MAYMEQMKVFRTLTNEETCLGLRLALPTRFVDADKGEPGAHAIRARLVVCETRGLSRKAPGNTVWHHFEAFPVSINLRT